MKRQTVMKLVILICLISGGMISSFLKKDWQAFFIQFTNQSIFLLPLFGMLLLLFFSPQIKGWIGEQRVRKVLKSLEANGMHILYNVFLRLPNGKTTQIDHVGVSSAGVFVIETKTFQGWIFGSEKSEYWTQKIYRSNKKFKNPLHQNYGHVMALKTVLSDEFGEIPYHSVVVFAGSAELKKVDSPNVTKLAGLLTWIHTRDTLVLQPETIERITGILQASRSASYREMKQHIVNIEKKKESAGKICPKCGCFLVERKGKHGSFIGCSSFPKCRYIYMGDRNPA